jgi:hypothetical protein
MNHPHSLISCIINIFFCTDAIFYFYLLGHLRARFPSLWLTWYYAEDVTQDVFYARRRRMRQGRRSANTTTSLSMARHPSPSDVKFLQFASVSWSNLPLFHPSPHPIPISSFSLSICTYHHPYPLKPISTYQTITSRTPISPIYLSFTPSFSCRP